MMVLLQEALQAASSSGSKWQDVGVALWMLRKVFMIMYAKDVKVSNKQQPRPRAALHMLLHAQDAPAHCRALVLVLRASLPVITRYVCL